MKDKFIINFRACKTLWPLSFHYHSVAAPPPPPCSYCSLFLVAFGVLSLLFPWFLTAEVAFSDLPWYWHPVAASIKDRLIKVGHVLAQN